MDKVIHIFYTNFADTHNKKILVGGAQNYFRSLCQLFSKNGYLCNIYQFGDNKSYFTIDQINIFSFPCGNGSVLKKMKKLFSEFSSNFKSSDLIIWGSENIGISTSFPNVIAIQHGIAFDMEGKFSSNTFFGSNIGSRIYKYFQCYKSRRNFQKFKNVVCVDYNYLNWIRTQLPRSLTENTSVIPNFATTIDKKNANNFEQEDGLRILFARRFSYERGVELLMDLIPRVLELYPKTKFTICGDGPYKDRLQRKFEDVVNVTISKFDVGDAEMFNLTHHITVIPTIGSEGTSFSLLEGMACGCIPIVSNVGGMTNVVLNGFNGYICEPNTESFLAAIKNVVNLTFSERLDLSTAAKATVEKSFSKDIWEYAWFNYVENLRLKNNERKN